MMMFFGSVSDPDRKKKVFTKQRTSFELDINY